MVDIELIRFALFQIKRAKKDPAKALRFSEVDALFVVRQAKKKGFPCFSARRLARSQRRPATEVDVSETFFEQTSIDRRQL
jgi:hypothetical protein